MPITAGTPKEVPATQAKVYDKYFMTFFQVRGADPNAAVTADIHLRLGRTENGVWEFDPNEPTVKINVTDLFTLAAQDESVGTALQATLAAVHAIAVSQGKIR